MNAVEIDIHRLPYMENLYKQIKEEADNMQLTRQRFTHEIETLENQISMLDKTIFPIEQNWKREHQKI